MPLHTERFLKVNLTLEDSNWKQCFNPVLNYMSWNAHSKFIISSFTYKYQLRHRNVKTEEVQITAVDLQEEEERRGKYHVWWICHTRWIAEEGSFAVIVKIFVWQSLTYIKSNSKTVKNRTILLKCLARAYGYSCWVVLPILLPHSSSSNKKGKVLQLTFLYNHISHLEIKDLWRFSLTRIRFWMLSALLKNKKQLISYSRDILWSTSDSVLFRLGSYFWFEAFWLQNTIRMNGFLFYYPQQDWALEDHEHKNEQTKIKCYLNPEKVI